MRYEVLCRRERVDVLALVAVVVVLSLKPFVGPQQDTPVRIIVWQNVLRINSTSPGRRERAVSRVRYRY